jgi:hypothetical protein
MLHCIALVCEIALSLQAHLALPTRWRFVERAVHPSRLLLHLQQQQEEEEDIDEMELSTGVADHHVKKKKKKKKKKKEEEEEEEEEEPPAESVPHHPPLPPVDVFVTTADPAKEPPIVALNTLLSAMALHYPPHRLACYVSDDGGSILTFWAISLAAAFATAWLPFCNRAAALAAAPMAPRAPGPYFLRHKHPAPPSLHDEQQHHSSSSSSAAHDFISQWKSVKV